MFGTRGNGGAAGTGGNDVVPQITQPTQAELEAAEALANQQEEMTRLRQLETERVRLAAAATLLAQQQLALVQPGVPPAYQPVSFNGALPGAPANSTVATAFGAIDPAQSRLNADNLLTFLSDQASNLLQLNSDKTLYAGLVLVNTRIKVVYGFGYGTSPIGLTSPVNNKILAMTGECSPIRQPTVFVFESSIRNKTDIIAFTEQGIEANLTAAGAGFRLPLARALSQEGNPRVNIMQCVPIPAHLVLDGFTQDLCPVEVYERLISCTIPSIAVDHAKEFLRAAMIGFRLNDAKPAYDIMAFVPPAPQGADEWAQARVQWFFPTVPLPPAPATGPPPAGPLQAPAQGIPFAQVQQLLAFLQTQQPQNNPAPAEEKKQDESSGLATYELNQTLIMCGLNYSEEQHLPSWFKEIQDKKLSDHCKCNLITEAISNKVRYRDAEVQCTPELFKMIKKRDWMGGDNSKRPLFGNAMKGLSPFSMLDLSEDEVSDLMAIDAALQLASTTTVADYKPKSSFYAKVPESAEDFMVMIKRFANLLFALFGGACPLFLHIVNIVENILQLSKSARDVMTQSTKAAILWIILIQSREFSRGKGELTAEFAEMQHGLAVKRAEITHAEVPAQLLAQPTIQKRQNNGGEKSAGKFESGKKQKLGTNKLTAINPILKPIADAWIANGKPKLRDICTFCKIYPNQLLADTQKCKNNTVFGVCPFADDCYLTHETASDEEAKKILGLLGHFTDQPEGLKPRYGRQSKYKN